MKTYLGPQDMTLNHRLTVSLPMAALGLIDNTVCLLTLGFIHPSLAMDWGFCRSLAISRKNTRRTA